MPRQSNRRENIIDIATTRFLINGYDNVTVDELCKISESTKGSFYHFFENKEALAIDVVNHVWNDTEYELGVVFQAEMSPLAQLHAEIDRIAASYRRMDNRRYFIGCPVGTLAVSMRGKSQKITRRLNFALTHMRQFYQQAFEKAVELHLLESDNDPAQRADELMLDVHGLSTLGKAYGNPARIRALASVIKDRMA